MRPLTSAEYATSVLAAAATNNVQLPFASSSIPSNRTINALVLNGFTLSGPGTLTITSGTVVAAQSSGISAPLAFGNAEAQFFLMMPGTSEVSGPISGSGGLTRSGIGTLTLSGVNTFTGPITVNGGVLSFGAPANLGPGLDPITLHGGTAGLTFTGAGSAAVARPVQLGGNVSQLAAAQNTGVLEMSGAIGGPGGLSLAGLGTIALTGVNSYEGPTFIGTNAIINSDAALGASSSVMITTPYVTLQLAGNLTTSRLFSIPLSAKIDTNGFDAAFNTAPIVGFSTTFTKLGAGAMRLRTPLQFNGSLNVEGGELRLEQDGVLSSLISNSVTASGVVTLDDSGRVLSNRLSSIVLNGGELRLVGNSTASVNEQMNVVALGENTSGTITLTAPGTSGVTLSLEYFLQNSASVLFRGDNLGGPAGSAFSRIVFTNVPSFPGGLIPGALASNSSTGAGATYAIYDSTIDAAGVVGVRPLLAADYTTGPEIRNPANGGTTPVNARFWATGPTTSGGAGNRLNLLRVSGTAAITLNPGQALTLDSATLIADAGANASINGGTLIFPANPAQLVMAGNLSINSRVDAAVLTKTGVGTLTIGGAARWASTFNLNEGTANVAGGDALRFSTVNIAAGTVLNFSQLPATASTIAGAGTIALSAAGNLTVQALTGAFAISGPGGLKITSYATFTTASTFSGSLAVSAESPLSGVTPRVTLSGNGTALNAASVRIDAGTVLHLDNSTNSIPRLGIVPLELNGGRFILTGGPVLIEQTLGTLAARGFSTLEINPTGNTTRLRFEGLSRVDRGTLHVSTTSSFLSSATLSFPASISSSLVGAGTTAFNRRIVPFATGLGDSSVGIVPVTVEFDNTIRPLDGGQLSFTLSTGDNVLIRNTALTSNVVATVNSLTAPHDLLGTGTVTVTSGVVIGTGATQIENGLSFGAAEAILSSHQSGSLTLSGPLTGSGGLTKSGPGTIALPAVNNIAGTLTINAGTLAFSNPAQLGAGTSAIVLHSGGLQWAGAGDLVFPRALRLLSGGLGSIGATDPAATLHVAGPITGPGGLNLTGRVVFDTAPAYTGPTQISGKLLLGSDALLGASAQVRFNGGTLALTGPWNTSREVLVLPPGVYTSTVDTAGFDAVLSGALVGSGYLTKIGAGNLTLGDAAGFSGQLRIDGGKLILGSPGVPSSNRIHDSAVIRLAGGTLEIAGYPGATREVFDDLTLTSGTINRLRLTAPGGGSQILQVGALRSEGNSLAILQADRLGESEGAFTRFVISTFAPASGTFLPNVVVADSMGQPAGFAIYDGTIDEAGPVGLRAARSGEYVSGAVIQNPANGGSTPTTAHFRASGAVQVDRLSATVQTLTLEPATALTLPPAGRLSVGPTVLTLAGSAPSVISGGTLSFGNGGLLVAGHDLTICSRIGDSPFQSGTLQKFGPAVLNLHGTVTNHPVSIGEGAIRLGGGDPLAGVAVFIAPGGILDTASRAVTVGSLTGSGLIDLGTNGVLSMKGTSTFSGSTRGSGTLSVGGPLISSSVLTPAGPLQHAGRIVVDHGLLTLQGAGRLEGATFVRVAGYGTVSLRNLNGIPASTALHFEQGTLDLQPGGTTLQLGPVIGYGLGTVVAGNDTSALQIDFASLSRGPDNAAVFRIDASNANLGANPGVGVTNIRFGPGFSANLVGEPGVTPVIPFMSATVPPRSYDNARLVTYDAVNGVRMLTDAEFSALPVDGANYRFTNSTTLNANISVNSLSNLGDPSRLSGTGSVTITGGITLLSSATIAVPIDFGARQGNIITHNGLRFTAPISGTAGLVLSGGEIELRAANIFTGPLFINGGFIRFQNMSAFGPDMSSITLYSTTLSQDGSGPLNFTRPLRLAGGVVTFQGSSNSEFTFSGPISGPGGLNLQFSKSMSIIGANSYTGPTTVRTDLTINGDVAFGQSSQIVIEYGTIKTTSPWITSKPVRTNGLFNLDTSGSDISLLGPLSSESALPLTKRGPGRLTIADAADFTGRVEVIEGILELNGLLSGGVTASSGTTVTGSGAVAGTLSVSGLLDPGEGTGAFTAGLLQMQANSTLRLQLDSATAFDRAVSLNAPSLGSNITLDLQIAPAFDPVDDFDEFVLIENASPSPLLFSGLSPLVYAGNALVEGEIFSTPGQMWRISYTGGTGNDVTVRAVPEPTAGLSFALGLALLASQRGRRNGKR